MISPPRPLALSMTSSLVPHAALRVFALHRPPCNNLRPLRFATLTFIFISMSVSIRMSIIPNSEPAPAAAHSPNSDEEIEDEVDSDNSPPIQD